MLLSLVSHWGVPLPDYRLISGRALLRRARLLFLLLLLLAPAPGVQAGTYSVTYSGGVVTSNAEGLPTSTQPYAQDPFGLDYRGYGSVLGTGSVDCSGAIGATFTWVADYWGEPTPAKVVVAQFSGTYYNSQSSGAGGGSRDNALGHTAQGGVVTHPDFFGPGEDMYERWGAQDGWLFEIRENPGASFSLILSPSANANAVDKESVAWVTYRAVAQPLEVMLTEGVGQPHEKRFLMGQQVTANLHNGGLTPTSYNWTASGGEPFKIWTVAGDHSSAQFTPLGSETESSFSFHFKRPDNNASVSCTAHLAVPAGALPAAGFDVTVIRNCRSVRPDSAEIGVWIGTTTPLPVGGPYDRVQLRDAELPLNPFNDTGLVFDGQVTTPMEFKGADTDQWNGWGAWNWTQLITPFEKRQRDGVWKDIGMSIPPPTRSIYGRLCLDNYYPYDGWGVANGDVAGSSDTPTDLLEPDPLVTAKDLLDSFECWFMYLPPGDGSVPVPLKKVVWFWEFHAVKSSGAWTVSGTLAQWGFAGDYPPHPEWDIVLYNDGLTYDY